VLYIVLSLFDDILNYLIGHHRVSKGETEDAQAPLASIDEILESQAKR